MLKLIALLLAAARLSAGVSESEYQDRLLAAARELHQQCSAMESLPKEKLDLFAEKIRAQEKAASNLGLAQRGKTFLPLHGAAISAGENELDSFISDYRDALLTFKPSSALPNYDAYKALALKRSKAHWENLGAEYESKYGGGEELNWLEVYLDNQLYKLKDSDGPPAFEPILRLSPIAYNWSGEAVFSMAQAGLNYYFFSGFMKKLNPLGLAVAGGNLNAKRPFLNMFDQEGFKVGAVLHIRKVEVGFFHDPAKGLLVTSSLNFQIIKGFF